MSRYFISLLLFCFSVLGLAQDEPVDLQPKDTIVYKEPYGLRVGIDLSRPTISFFEPEYTGLEIVGDYRITQSLYLAAELGTENRDRQEDLYNFTTSGSYLKVGLDYNTYGNWLDEQNLIYVGGRMAYSNFSQTLNNFQIFDSNRYWHPDGFAEGSSEAQEFTGRSRVWIEAVLGIKAELFANIYLGGSVRMGYYFGKARRDGESFPDLFIPGFNKVTDNARFGIGYNFTLSYFVPLYKKPRVNKKKKPVPRTLEEEEEQ